MSSAIEQDVLNRDNVEFGRTYGVPTPGHETIHALIKGVEASWQQ